MLTLAPERGWGGHIFIHLLYLKFVYSDLHSVPLVGGMREIGLATSCSRFPKILPKISPKVALKLLQNEKSEVALCNVKVALKLL